MKLPRSATSLPADRVSLETDEGPGETSQGRSLAHLAEEAARCTPDCCAAAVTASYTPGADAGAAPDVPLAVTHPDLSGLVGLQLESGEGPIPEALSGGEPVSADDLLHETRWPAYRAKALDAGLRSSATLPYRREGLALTITVFSFRPYRLADAVTGSAALLADLATTVLVRDRRYREALAEVEQLDSALRSRPVVDQACGIVMVVVGCAADEAFALLRRMSQRTNRKLYDLAEALVSTRGRGAEEELRRMSRTP
ncbi:ANTAR domain-containing response regulator [Streptomyces sp. NPDC054796]